MGAVVVLPVPVPLLVLVLVEVGGGWLNEIDGCPLVERLFEAPVLGFVYLTVAEKLGRPGVPSTM